MRFIMNTYKKLFLLLLLLPVAGNNMAMKSGTRQDIKNKVFHKKSTQCHAKYRFGAMIVHCMTFPQKFCVVHYPTSMNPGARISNPGENYFSVGFLSKLLKNPMHFPRVP